MKSKDLKRIREELGLTQQQLAEALQTTRVSVARYEAGMRKIPGVVSVVLDQLQHKTMVPMAGLVAAGSPIEPVPQSELVDIPPSMLRGGDTFALKVKGESMKDEGILPGDLVVVRKQETAKNGQTIVALVNREATIKRMSRKQRTLNCIRPTTRCSRFSCSRRMNSRSKGSSSASFDIAPCRSSRKGVVIMPDTTAETKNRLMDLEKTVAALDHQLRNIQSGSQSAKTGSLVTRFWSLMSSKQERALMSAVCNQRVRPNMKVMTHDSPRA